MFGFVYFCSSSIFFGGVHFLHIAFKDLAKTCLADIMADDTNDVVAVDLKVSSEAIVIIDKAAEEAVQEHATAEVMYCSMVDAVHLVYVTNSPHPLRFL